MRVDGGVPRLSHGPNTSRPIHRQFRAFSVVEIGHSRHTFSSAAFSGWSPILVRRFCTWFFAFVPIQLLYTTCVDCRLPTLHGSTLLRCEARTRRFFTWSRRRNVDDASATKRDETSEKKKGKKQKKRRFFLPSVHRWQRDGGSLSIGRRAPFSFGFKSEPPPFPEGGLRLSDDRVELSTFRV